MGLLAKTGELVPLSAKPSHGIGGMKAVSAGAMVVDRCGGDGPCG
jgi:hypothetical protein